MHAKQLPIPPAAVSDTRAVELLRVWAAQGTQHVSLATNLWKDPATWGIMLVDLSKHIASAYKLTTGQDRDDVLKRIREGFDAEWGSATDVTSGSISG